jgi:hypothetical protein
MKVNLPLFTRVFNNGCSKAYIFIAVCCFIFLSNSCKKSSTSESAIPNVPVNFTIQLSLPAYTNLNSPGGSVDIPSVGYRGIVVYRMTNDIFVAFDKACPYDFTASGSILVVDSSLINMIDYHCGSRFGLTSGGSVVHGPATKPMKQYGTTYDPGNNIVAVFN